jgi:copper ion binding protein
MHETSRLNKKETVDESERKEDDKMATTLKVKGMSCQHCVMSVTKALNQLEGVKDVQVDLAKGEVRFESTKEVASNRIAKAIEDAGYEIISTPK